MVVCSEESSTSEVLSENGNISIRDFIFRIESSGEVLFKPSRGTRSMACPEVTADRLGFPIPRPEQTP